MGADDFLVTAKRRACNNQVVRSRFFARDETRAFDSRRDAEAFAEHASRDGDVRVEIQAAAPQDESKADAYLVAIPARNTTEPVNPDDDRWRFHTEANQQGAIGEVLATTPRTNPPALTWFVRHDLDDPEGLVVRIEDDVGSVGRWWPDCRVTASVDGDTVEEYLCEIKTGDASFQRGQRTGMDRHARLGRVLTIRVRIESLPDEYEITVDDYTGPSGGVGASGDGTGPG